MKLLDAFLSWTRIPALAFAIHAGAYYASWAVNGGFAGQTWIAMALLIFFMHETATRSPSYPGRYIRLFRRSKVEEMSASVYGTALAFGASLAIIASLFYV